MRVVLVMQDGTRETVEGTAEEIACYCQDRPVAEWFVELVARGTALKL